MVHPNGDVWWFANPPSRREPEPGRAARHHLRAVAGPAGRPVPRRHRPDARHHRGHGEDRSRAGTPTTSRRCRPGTTSGWSSSATPCTPRRPSSGPGRIDGDRGRGRAGQVPARHPRHRSAAFAAFKALRQERVERVVKHGKRSGDGKAQGRVGATIRDLMLPMLRAEAWSSQQQPGLDVRLPHRLARQGRRWLAPSMR